MTRGALAAGAIRTYVLARPHHARLVLRLRGRRGSGRPRALGRVASCANDAGVCLEAVRRPVALPPREAARVKTHVVGPMCHVLWQWTTGDAVGPNMMTRNSYALNMALRDAAGARQAGARDPRGEHGRRQEAVAPSTSSPATGRRCSPRRFSRDEQIRRVLRTTADDLEALSWAGTHGSVASGHAVGRVHARLGGGRDLRGDRPGSRHGRHELDGARHRAARRRRPPGDDPLRRPRGRDGRRRHHPALGPRLARRRSAAPAPARSTASRRSSPRRRSASRSARRLQWPPPAARTSSRRTTSAAASADDRPRLPLRRPRPRSLRGGVRARGRVGAVLPLRGRVHRHGAAARRRGAATVTSSSTGGSRRRPTTRFSASTRPSTCAGATRHASTTLQELRFGTFENIWHADPSAP